MELPELIRKMGIANFAKKYRVTERAATDWLYLARRPKPAIAVKLEAIEGMTVAEIYPPKKARKAA